jgi:hypothetical protein
VSNQAAARLTTIRLPSSLKHMNTRIHHGGHHHHHAISVLAAVSGAVN